MLDEKLEQANKAAFRRHLAIIGIVGLLAGVAVFAVWNLDFDAETPERSASAPPVAAEDSASEPASTPAARTDQPPVPAPDPGIDDTSEAREAFKRLLRQYDAGLAPRIAGPGFKAWDLDVQAALTAERQAAVDAFSTGDYAGAVDAVNALAERTSDAIDAWNNAFADAMVRAGAALADDDYDTALAAVTEASRLRPGDPDAAALGERVDALPAVLAALERVRIARVEADRQAEIDAIDEVLRLDPDRAGLAERRTELRTQIREARFASAIQAGLDAVARDDLDTAMEQLNVARTIHAGRDETALLERKVEDLERKISVQEFLTFAGRHAEKDEWTTALGFYRQALLVEPDNKTALQGRALAADIAGAQTAVAQHLAAPDRLSSANVATQARDTLARAKTFKAFSATLASSAGKLEELLELYSREIDVRVLSDGETTVAVRGVGRVGRITEKVIRLKPGTYTFEGNRAGYVSKLVRLEVPPGATLVEVTVISDEPV